MAISARGNSSFSRLKALLSFQRFKHTSEKGDPQTQLYADIDSDSLYEQGKIDISKWRKLDSRTLGITRSMISSPSWVVLKVLQSQGFEAYLVGGCVRDLILNKVPKDFDVITTAALKQIKKQFHRAEIVGRRFPICIVHVKGSAVEVSSFETEAKHPQKEEKINLSRMPSGIDKKDIVRWKNSMHRDFTINSLFFDPFVNKVYDYANGMMDLRSLKLRTLIPAQLSFKEDCARILRGLRVAARLGLSFSTETETAIHNLSSSILILDKTRIMMEMNYMMSYGAAEPSLSLLREFNLLELLLPFHAAYLAQQASKQFSKISVMLMKLFSNVDKIVGCGRPSDCSLWISILALHMALVNTPQDALVVWTFASVLYHGGWNEGVNFSRVHARAPSCFVPEISETRDFMSDHELAERVSQLASSARDSVDAFTKTDSLLRTMDRFPDFQCPGLVFVSRKAAQSVSQLFSVLVQDAESYRKRRKSFEIDYDLLGRGKVTETRFVLGKVILDTLSSGILHRSEVVEEEKDDLHSIVLEHDKDVFEKNMEMDHIVGKKDKKRIIPPSSAEEKQKKAKKEKSVDYEFELRDPGIAKKEKAISNTSSKETGKKKEEIVENKKCLDVAKKDRNENKSESDCISRDGVTKKQQKIGMCELQPEEMDAMQENALERKESQSPPQERRGTKKKKKTAGENEKCVEGNVDEKQQNHLLWEEITENVQSAIEKGNIPPKRIKPKEKMFEKKEEHLHQKNGVSEKYKKPKQEVFKEEPSRPPLSSLFK